jgi:DNA-directed RNA polymerase subunit H (RpoH/RPB5)
MVLEKNECFSLSQRQGIDMEDRALEILRTMLKARKLDTKTERLTFEDLPNANAYTVGNVFVAFSQKDKGLQEKDVRTLVAFATDKAYKNGIVIVSMQKPSENVLRVVKTLSKDRVQFFHIRQLQFDITTHRYAMPHRILNEDEKKAVFDQYHIESDAKAREVLPWIDSQDPMVKWIGGIPGDIIEVLRHSDVAGQIRYIRCCVEDTNIQ